MKKLIIIIFALLFLASCASLLPGKSYNKLKPKKPKKKSYSVELIQPYESVELISIYG